MAGWEGMCINYIHPNAIHSNTWEPRAAKLTKGMHKNLKKDNNKNYQTRKQDKKHHCTRSLVWKGNPKGTTRETGIGSSRPQSWSVDEEGKHNRLMRQREAYLDSKQLEPVLHKDETRIHDCWCQSTAINENLISLKAVIEKSDWTDRRHFPRAVQPQGHWHLWACQMPWTWSLSPTNSRAHKKQQVHHRLDLPNGSVQTSMTGLWTKNLPVLVLRNLREISDSPNLQSWH